MKVRLAERDCSCRGCNKTLKRHVDKGFFHYSSANRGMNIIFCKDCCEKIIELWREDES